MVYYNSFEQGISKTLQQAIRRNGFADVAQKITFGDKESYEQMCERLSRRNGPRFCFIDSRDYMDMTLEQFKELETRFPGKAFIIICWQEGKQPRSVHGQNILYRVDVRVFVKDFVASVQSRFEGDEPYIIWREGAIKRGALKIEEVPPRPFLKQWMRRRQQRQPDWKRAGVRLSREALGTYKPFYMKKQLLECQSGSLGRKIWSA